MTAILKAPHPCLRRARRRWCSLVLAAAMPMLSLAAAADSFDRRITAAHRDLDDWRFDKARESALRIYAERPNDADAVVLMARVHYHSGDYPAAIRLYESLGRDALKEEGLREEYDLARSAWEVTQGYVAHPSKSGRFVMYVSPGRDELLPLYAFDAIEAAVRNIGEDLDWLPKTPVRIEVYPEPEDLARVTSLTAKEIKNSGTIALCKYNRLMVTSPRALVRGYPWLDTLVHEYVHYVIGNRYGGSVPIWVHEGVAKYLEVRWRSKHGSPIPHFGGGLLAQALKNNRLITFDQMHPSMAKLPTQKDTALAFTEVQTAVMYLESAGGKPMIRKLLQQFSDRPDEPGYKFAVKGATGMDFEAFEAAWRNYMKTLSLPAAAGERENAAVTMKFREGRKEEGDDLRPEDVMDPQAERFLRLGEILRERGRPKAAALEYAKAAAKLREADPVVQNKLASAWIESNQPADAIKALQAVMGKYPQFVSSHINMARALLAAGDAARAMEHYKLVLEINPFHPEPHQKLLEYARANGDKALEDRETQALDFLRGEKKTRVLSFEPLAGEVHKGAIVIESSPPAAAAIRETGAKLDKPGEKNLLEPGIYQIEFRSADGKWTRIVPVEILPRKVLKLQEYFF